MSFKKKKVPVYDNEEVPTNMSLLDNSRSLIETQLAKIHSLQNTADPAASSSSPKPPLERKKSSVRQKEDSGLFTPHKDLNTSFNFSQESEISSLPDESSYTPTKKKKKKKLLMKKSPRIRDNNMPVLDDNLLYGPTQSAGPAGPAEEQTPRRDPQTASELRRVISQIAGENYMDKMEDDSYLDRLDKQKLLFDIEKKDTLIAEIEKKISSILQDCRETQNKYITDLKNAALALKESKDENRRLQTELAERDVAHESRIESMRGLIEKEKINVQFAKATNKETIDRLKIENEKLLLQLSEKAREILNLKHEPGSAPRVQNNLLVELEGITAQNANCQKRLVECTEELALERQKLQKTQDKLEALTENIKTLEMNNRELSDKHQVLSRRAESLSKSVESLQKHHLYYPANISNVISDVQKKMASAEKIIEELKRNIGSFSPQQTTIIYYQKNIENLGTEIKLLEQNMHALNVAIIDVNRDSNNIMQCEKNKIYLQYALGNIIRTEAEKALRQSAGRNQEDSESVLAALSQRFDAGASISEYIMGDGDVPETLVRSSNHGQLRLLQKIARLKECEKRKKIAESELEVYKNIAEHILYGRTLGAWSRDSFYRNISVQVDHLKNKLANCKEEQDRLDKLESEFRALSRRYIALESASNLDMYYYKVLVLCSRFIFNASISERDLDVEIGKIRKELRPPIGETDTVGILVNHYKLLKLKNNENEKIFSNLQEDKIELEKKYYRLMSNYDLKTSEFAQLDKIKFQLGDMEKNIKILEAQLREKDSHVMELNREKEQLIGNIYEQESMIIENNKLLMEANADITILESLSQKLSEDLKKNKDCEFLIQRCKDKYNKLRGDCMRKIEIANKKIESCNKMTDLYNSTVSRHNKQKKIANEKYRRKKTELRECFALSTLYKQEKEKCESQIEELRGENAKLLSVISRAKVNAGTATSAPPAQSNASTETALIDNYILQRTRMIGELESKVSELSQQIILSEEKIKALTDERDIAAKKYENQIQIEKKKYEDCSNILSNLRKEYESLNAELQRCKPHIKSMQDSISKLTEEKKKFYNENTQLKIDIGICQEEKKSHIERIRIHDETIKIRDETIKKITDSVEYYREQSQFYQTEKEDILNKFVSLSDESKYTFDENVRLKRETTDMEEIILGKQSAYEAIQIEKNFLEERLKRIVSQFNLMVEKLSLKISNQNEAIFNFKKNKFNNREIEFNTTQRGLFPSKSYSGVDTTRLKFPRFWTKKS
jgi:hypothetical protein